MLTKSLVKKHLGRNKAMVEEIAEDAEVYVVVLKPGFYSRDGETI